MRGSSAEIENFGPCSGLLPERVLVEAQTKQPKRKQKQQGKRSLQKARKLIPLRNETTEIMRELMIMQQDQLAIVVKNDPFIISNRTT